MVTGISACVRKRTVVEDTQYGFKFTSKMNSFGSGHHVLAHKSEHSNN